MGDQSFGLLCCWSSGARAAMAQNVFGAWSMVQLSLRLQRVTKTKQWEMFQRAMLAIVLMIWFITVLTSVFFRLSTGMSDCIALLALLALDG